MNIWFILILIMILSLIVQGMLNSKFNKYSKVPTGNGMTGAEIAMKMLNDNGIYDVQVVPTITRSAGSGSGNGSASHMGDSPRPKLKVSPSVKFETNGESGEGQALDTIFESGSYVQVYTQRDVV